MLSALVVTIRETFEASLLVGVVLALLTQERQQRMRRIVWAGVAVAAAASAALGIVLVTTVGALHGRVQELVEGLTMAAAAGILTYVLWWMRRRSRELSTTLRARVQTALGAGSAMALLTLVVLTVFREGAETVLYLSAAAASSGRSVATGGALGIAAGVGVGYTVYHGGTRLLDVRRFFQATTILLVAFAAGLVGRATLALQAGGLFPGTVSVWDTSRVLSERSPLGAGLSALAGYTARPALLQMIFILGYLALLATLATNPTGTRWRPIGRDYSHPLYRLIRNRRLIRLLPLAMGVLLVAPLAVALFGVPVGPLWHRLRIHRTDRESLRSNSPGSITPMPIMQGQ